MSIIVLEMLWIICIVTNMACGVIPSIRCILWCYLTLRVLLSMLLCCSQWMFWYVWSLRVYLWSFIVYYLFYISRFTTHWLGGKSTLGVIPPLYIEDMFMWSCWRLVCRIFLYYALWELECSWFNLRLLQATGSSILYLSIKLCIADQLVDGVVPITLRVFGILLI